MDPEATGAVTVEVVAMAETGVWVGAGDAVAVAVAAVGWVVVALVATVTAEAS